MSTLAALASAQTTPEAQAVLSAVQSSLGLVPNLFRVAANSPAALNALVGLNGALAKGRLRAKVRESIALEVAQENGCDYGLSAHTVLGKGAGLNDDEIAGARAGKAVDPHTNAILTLAGDIVRQHGAVGAAAIERARASGVTDAEIVEIVADTDIDFPVVRSSERVAV
jgi:uncharacterized peroxidase-related enzyme